MRYVSLTPDFTITLIHYVTVQGRFCLYKSTEEEEEDWDEIADTSTLNVNRGIPPNSPLQVLIRVYIVSVRWFFYRSNLLLDV